MQTSLSFGGSLGATADATSLSPIVGVQRDNDVEPEDRVETAKSVSHATDGTGLVLSKMPHTFRLTNGAYNGSQFSFKSYKSGWTGYGTARITTYRVSELGEVISESGGAASTFLAYSLIYNGTADPMTKVDATVGTVGLIATGSRLIYYEIPGVGEVVGLYSTARVTIDVFYNLGAEYHPISSLLGLK